MLKAKVFISCGQQSEKEKEIGTKIVDYFKDKGFEPYFAEEVHSPLSLTQNIFNNLNSSEYFVCINFKRKNSDFGSLFVQQELAIAAFKEIPLAAFHQPGVKLQGVSKYLHVNSIEFNTVNDIVKNLKKLTKKWHSKSKNQFKLSCGNKHPNVILNNQPGVLTNWYHIIVENLSSSFNAKNCYCFVESIYDLRNKKYLFFKRTYKNELVWAGTGRVNVNIPCKAKRDIDAIFTQHGTSRWLFHEINTSTLYRYPFLSDGRYKIIYTLHSDNFPIAKLELNISLLRDILRLIKARQIIQHLFIVGYIWLQNGLKVS